MSWLKLSSAAAALLARALLPLLLVGQPLARAQTEVPMRAPLDDAAATVTAVRLAPGERLTLDGSLSHPAWQRAPVWNAFVEKEPRTGDRPPQETRFQVLFDDHALYVGVNARDSSRALIRDLPVRRDLVNRTQDFVVVYIDAIGTKRSAQFFRVNAAGSTADGLHTAADDSEDFSPDFDWDAAVKHQDDGWTAVLRLPFASLRYAPGAVQNWRIMVARRLPREHFHLITSVLVPRDAANFIQNLQPLAGVSLPPSAHFLTLRPSFTLRRRSEEESGAPRQRRTDVDATLDLKWRPRAELVVDATLNPDFSQVALDVPQLAGNTRFAIAFPEKRPFFFESADLLRSPTEALYTRTFTAPRWGLRGTWRETTLAGTALLVDDRGGGLVNLPGAYGTDYADQPASRTLAARLRLDEGHLTWGGLLAARRYQGGAGDNDVLGPDLTWQLGETWRLRGQWLASRTTARATPQGTLAQGPEQTGQRRVLRFYRNADFSDSNIGIDDIEAGFRHDSGFVNQAGTRLISAFHAQGWADVGPFNLFFVNLQAEQTVDRASGQLIKQDIRPGIWGAGRSNLEWYFGVHPWSLTRTRAGGALLQERYIDTGLVMTPATWWPLVDTGLTIGRLADAAAARLRSGARWNFSAKLRPLRPLELEPSLSLAWLDDGGVRRYHETAAQVLAIWHLNATMNLRAIVQRSSLDRRAEPGLAAARDGSQAASLTFTWQRSSGTALYLGASSSRGGVPTAQRAAEAFVKLQFDVDEMRQAW